MKTWSALLPPTLYWIAVYSPSVPHLGLAGSFTRQGPCTTWNEKLTDEQELWPYPVAIAGDAASSATAGTSARHNPTTLLHRIATLLLLAFPKITRWRREGIRRLRQLARLGAKDYIKQPRPVRRSSSRDSRKAPAFLLRRNRAAGHRPATLSTPTAVRKFVATLDGYSGQLAPQVYTRPPMMRVVHECVPECT